MTSTLSIPNMTCGGCAKGVAATLLPLGIVPVVNLEQRTITVSGEVAPAIQALRADGWDAQPGG